MTHTDSIGGAGWGRRIAAGLAGTGALLASTGAAFAEEAPTLDTGDTAWMLTATALVLLMTIPGLALFYGGMVRRKNVIATTLQSFAICCLATVLWMVAGYSLAFSDGGSMNAVVGGLSNLFLAGSVGVLIVRDRTCIRPSPRN